MTRFDALALAGGGNRCYWQGGVLDALWRDTDERPHFIVAVSAGAFQAAYTLAGLGDQVRARVDAVCRQRRRNVEWDRLARGRSPFAVGDLYRALLVETFDDAALARLRAGPELFVKLSRPPRFVPTALATLAGLAAYQAEKTLTNAVHPRAGRRLGFSPDYVSTHAVRDPAELIDALAASASVPPFMPVGRVGGRPALDGGLVDNVPVAKLIPVEATGGRTLVLATRVYKGLPDVPGRTYLQPSRPIAVNKFAVTDAEGVRAAYALGLADGAAFAASLRR